MGTGHPQPPFAAVVSVGNELLLGQTEDTNGSWLAAELSDLGFHVRGRQVVGDVSGEIRKAVRWGLDVAELVVVTGGLGPTPDDLTRESVAREFGVSLEVDAGLMDALEARYRAMGRGPVPEAVRKMARVPLGGAALQNPRGTAPGLVFKAGEGGLCILLPGVPPEMRAIFREGVAPLLRDRSGHRLRPVMNRVIHTFGVPESVLMEEVEKVLPEDLGPVAMAYLPDPLSVRLRISARGEDPEESRAHLERVEGILEPVLSRYRFESGTGDLAEAVGWALRKHGLTLAVAESCTGGLLAKRMTDIPGSSEYFLGGVVAYDNAVKEGILGLPRDLIDEVGAVSEEVAGRMAAAVAGKLGASVGAGITGIAGPGGGTPEKPVGTVWYAVHLDGRTLSRRDVFPGDRELIRERAAQATMGLLLRCLREVGAS